MFIKYYINVIISFKEIPLTVNQCELFRGEKE